MKREVLKAPPFRRLVRSDVNLKSRSVSLEYEANNGAFFQIEIEIPCIQLTLAALAGQLGVMQSAIPSLHSEDVQPIEVKELEITQRVSGGIGLVLNLEGGGALQIGLPDDFVESFADGLQQISAQLNPVTH